MIIVHNIFVCKPGNASKLARLFKEWADMTSKETGKGGGIYVMTDMTGQFHRVIMVSTHENLAVYEEDGKKQMEEESKNPQMMAKFKDMNEMYVSGSREIYKVW